MPEELELGSGQVQVIGACLDLSPARLAELTGNLSADELARAARFYARRHRNRFVARRGLLRELLGLLAHAHPASLVFSTGAFGKPAVAMPWPARSLQFSTSHSEALAVFAIGRDAALGVDVEAVRPLPDLPALVGAVFSDRERREWHELPRQRRLQAFFDVWARKEAFLKGTGQGLSKAPGEITVPLDHCGPDQPLSVLELASRVPEWTLRSLSTGEFAIALALSRPPALVNCWAWSQTS